MERPNRERERDWERTGKEVFGERLKMERLRGETRESKRERLKMGMQGGEWRGVEGTANGEAESEQAGNGEAKWGVAGNVETERGEAENVEAERGEAGNGEVESGRGREKLSLSLNGCRCRPYLKKSFLTGSPESNPC